MQLSKTNKEGIMPNYDFNYSLPKYSHTGSKDLPAASKATTEKLGGNSKKSSPKKATKSKNSPAKGGDMEY